MRPGKVRAFFISDGTSFGQVPIPFAKSPKNPQRDDRQKIVAVFLPKQLAIHFPTHYEPRCAD
jgi:hypothetical protein